jgi:hypothetical protein
MSYAAHIWEGYVPTQWADEIEDPALREKFLEEYPQYKDESLPNGVEQGNILAGVFVTVHSNAITWFSAAPMYLDAQSFRDEIYFLAAEAQKSVSGGCGAYYRGTNSYHTKAHHHEAFESMYNHNHYIVDGDLEVSPEHFEQHIMAFHKADEKKHAGKAKFLPYHQAVQLCAEYKQNWEQRHKLKTTRPINVQTPLEDARKQLLNEINGLQYSSQARIEQEERDEEFTAEDREEFATKSGQAGLCLDEKRDLSAGVRGGRSDLANVRQNPAMPLYAYEVRADGDKRQRDIEEFKRNHQVTPESGYESEEEKKPTSRNRNK